MNLFVASAARLLLLIGRLNYYFGRMFTDNSGFVL